MGRTFGKLAALASALVFTFAAAPEASAREGHGGGGHAAHMGGGGGGGGGVRMGGGGAGVSRGAVRSPGPGIVIRPGGVRHGSVGPGPGIHHGGHRGHHRGGRGIYIGAPFYGYSSYYAYDDCGWLRRKAIRTGSSYWWDRYEQCRYDY